jgi:photosystem II stability/assembly factor-like uncharacterized protein
MERTWSLVFFCSFLAFSCKHDYNPLSTTSELKNKWHLISESNSENVIEKIFFANTEEGWMIGHEGTILHSTDGGYAWKEQNGQTENNLVEIYFTDAKHGWITGYYNTLLYTSNSGKDWQKINVYNDTTKINMDILFIDNQTGWMLNNAGYIYKTSDAGQLWNELFILPNSGWSKIIFLDPLNGYTKQLWGHILMKTTDGGKSWESIDLSIPDAPLGIFVKDFCFVDKFTGFFIHSWRSGGIMDTATPIRKTIDGGYTWSHQDSIMYPFLHILHFIDSEKGYLVGGGAVYSTTDGGKDWNYTAPLTHSGFLTDIFFYENKVGWISSSDGTVYRYNF